MTVTSLLAKPILHRRLLMTLSVLLMLSVPFLLSPEKSVAEPTMADEHDDFWKYISDTDRERDVRKRKERRADELEKEQEDMEILSRKEGQQRPALYGDLTSARLKRGLGYDQEKLVGADQLVNENDIFSKDKNSGRDFMATYLYQSDASDDTMRPLLGAVKKKLAMKKDDADSQADPRMMEMQRLLRLNYELGDWEPSKVDLHDNGGFTHQKDNGRPVPYRLNGHLDVNRKLPWDAED